MSNQNSYQPIILNSPEAVPPLIINVQSKLGKESFYDFVRMCFPVVCPDVKFSESWHIKLLCNYAQATYEGKILNLMVNIPPRHSKSLIFLVFFPAWVWANNPKKEFICASFGQDLAIEFSMKCRNLISSDFYQERWPLQLAKDENSKDCFKNIKGGVRRAVGTNSAVTGLQGHFLLADDLLRVQDAYSEAIREGVNSWYGGTFSNRRSDPDKTVKIILGQRIHPSDVFGYLLERDKKGTWEHVVLPARFTGKRYTSSIGLDDPRVIEGEVLWPDVYGEKQLDSLTENMSDIEIQGQMQQNPYGFEGNIFKPEWFDDRFTTVSNVKSRWQSWDTAASINDSAAYSTCVTGELDDKDNLYIIDVWRGRVDFTDLQAKAEELAEKWNGGQANLLKRIIIENKSTGTSLLLALKRSSVKWVGDLIQPFNPGIADKNERCLQAALWCSMGLVHLPESRIWLDDFYTEELLKVPQCKYRDQSDAFSQLCIYLESYLRRGLVRRRREGKN